MATTLRIILGFAIIALANCDDRRDSLPDLTCGGRIAANDLDASKECIQKSWKVHYLQFKDNRMTFSNTFIDLKANDSIYFIFEGDILAESRYEISFNNSERWLRFQTWRGLEFTLGVKDMQGDTLYLSDLSGESYYALTPSPFLRNYNCGYTGFDKALNQIRSCVRGKWELVSAYGGISGVHLTFTNSFLTFLPNDSVIFIQEGQVKVRDKIVWRTILPPQGGIAFMIELNAVDNFPEPLLFHGTYDNKLELRDSGDDGLNYVLIRLTE